MNFSVCLLQVFLLVLHDICVAKVMIKYGVADEIETVYAERKKDGRYLGHIASLTQEERLQACKFYRVGDYIDDQESQPHIYEVVIPDAVIPDEEKDEAGMPVAESSKTTTKAKVPMDIDPEEETGVEPKFKQLKLEETEEEMRKLKKEDEAKIQQERQDLKNKNEEKTEPIDIDPAEEEGVEPLFRQLKLEKMKQELKNEDEGKTEPKMIYNQEIAFRCRTRYIADKHFILSYGFAQKMFFVSEPVGRLDKNKRFWGRKMKLTGYMFAPPISPWLRRNDLNQKYLELRKRTEKLRRVSPTLLDDIEKHDDISALTFQEKNILCASIFETKPYKVADLIFIPTDDPADFEYVKYPIGVFNPEISKTETFDTDFLLCKAGQKNSLAPTIVGVTRSYEEGGTVYTSVIQKNKNKQILDTLVTNIAVLSNRKYAGGREGVLEVLEDIRAQQSDEMGKYYLTSVEAKITFK